MVFRYLLAVFKLYDQIWRAHIQLQKLGSLVSFNFGSVASAHVCYNRATKGVHFVKVPVFLTVIY